MKKGIIFLFVLALFASGCTNKREHLSKNDINNALAAREAGDMGIDNVLPTVGKIYIENITQGSQDGNSDEMLKAHLIYTLSADISKDNYSDISSSSECFWESKSEDTVFTDNNSSMYMRSRLAVDEYGVYACQPVQVEFKKDGEFDKSYNPDSQIIVKFINKYGEYVRNADNSSEFSINITLNTADRHNIINLATSPATVLFQRADGLFQAGFTAYRGMTGLQQYIGSAMYEARVKSPGGSTIVDPALASSNYTAELEEDKARITQWLENSSVDENAGIYSESAFISSYGPPIALPAFRKSDINYRKLRVALLRHNNYPVIISYDKKLYTMGHITNLNDISENYPYHIRNNDNWFAYAGVQLKSSSDLNKFQVGEIKPVNGVEAKFISTVPITSDLDTTIALNETDKEYYMSGNPFYSPKLCKESATYSTITYAFTYNFNCTFDSTAKAGAVKLTGLQKKIGDASTAVATDSDIYYIGRDGKGYYIDLRPEGINGENIRNGLPIQSVPVNWDVAEDKFNFTPEEKASKYVVDMTYANMNHAVLPTLLLNDGSILFTVRKIVNGEVTNVVRHFYINKNGISVNDPKSTDNIKMQMLIGPTAAYGEDGKIYYFTDVPALGISYKPTKTNKDEDYIAFTFGDPVQFIGTVTDKENFFNLHYGVLDINDMIKSLDSNNQSLENMAYLPYNPLTPQFEDVLISGDGSVSLETVLYRGFRTNSHLFVNMNKNADLSYIAIPYYFYGFADENTVEPSSWIIKNNGLMAAEVKNNNISKVYSTFDHPKLPFKYTPYSRNTTFFANKKGLFSFVSYNTRLTKSICQDNAAGCTTTDDANKLDDILVDYFYFAKNSDNYLEEANGMNNYISTPFVEESRMSNFPDTQNYAAQGFEPQLISSWFSYEYKETPETRAKSIQSTELLPAYIPQYWFESIKGRFSSFMNLSYDDFINSFTGKSLYQYAYGVGRYRYYPVKAFPAWRARKLNSEILQYQSRYGTLVPISHGATAEKLYGKFLDGFSLSATLGIYDTTTYVAPRKYMNNFYTFYDRDKIAQGDDLGSSAFGDLNDAATTNIVTNGIGYIQDKGNYMWRNEQADTSGTGNIPLSEFPFVEYN